MGRKGEKRKEEERERKGYKQGGVKEGMKEEIEKGAKEQGIWRGWAKKVGGGGGHKKVGGMGNKGDRKREETPKECFPLAILHIYSATGLKSRFLCFGHSDIFC